jgi:hypothetical protein
MEKNTLYTILVSTAFSALLNLSPANSEAKNDCAQEAQKLINLMERKEIVLNEYGKIAFAIPYYKVDKNAKPFYECINDEVIKRTKGKYYLESMPEGKYIIYTLKETPIG